MTIDVKDLFDARRARLKAWIKAHYGKAADFQRQTKVNQGQLSGVLSGSKSFGEKFALSAEAASQGIAGKPPMPENYLFNPFEESRAMRLNRDTLSHAITVAMDSPHPLTAEAIIEAYALLIETLQPPPLEVVQQAKKQRETSDDIDERRDKGTIDNPRRKARPGKAYST